MDSTEPISPTLDWIVTSPKGLYCPPGDFYIDPGAGVDIAVISHAHADHYRKFHRTAYATPATHALAKVRYRNAAPKSPEAYGFNESFSVGPVKVTFISAGHMLGSAQILMEYKGQSALYTGDFNTVENPTCQPLAIPKIPIDVLICESTFGEKKNHKEPKENLREIVELAGRKPIMIGVYVLGKAQRVNQMLTEMYPLRPVFIEHEINKFHKVYAEYGVEVGKSMEYRRKWVKVAGDQFFYLVPPRMLSSYANDPRYFLAFASGWNQKKKLYYLDANLDISDHPDHTQTLNYIQEVAPKEVWFFHGYPDLLRIACKSFGIPSIQLNL